MVIGPCELSSLFRAIAHLGEVGRQFLGAPDLAGGDVLRSGKNLGGVLENAAGEPRVNHALEYLT